MAVIKTADEGQTIDEICYAHYGYTAGAVEAVLNANPRLCEQLPHLPLGFKLVLPDLASTNSTEAMVVRLWD